MCLFEYDEEKHLRGEREEGRMEGRKEGRKEGRMEGIEEEREKTIKMVLEMVNDNIISIEEAGKRLGIDVEKLKEKLNG